MLECPNGDNDKHHRHLKTNSGAKGRRSQIKYRTKQKNSKIESGKIMMQEKLPLHQKEREVMKEPAKRKEATKLVVFDHTSYKSGMSFLNTL